jgi:hypothetical protein
MFAKHALKQKIPLSLKTKQGFTQMTRTWPNQVDLKSLILL